MGLLLMTQVGPARLTGTVCLMLCTVCKADARPQPCVVQSLTRVLSLCTVHHAEGCTMCQLDLWLLDMAANTPAQLHRRDWDCPQGVLLCCILQTAGVPAVPAAGSWPALG